jgi:hypothetical protein
VRLTSASKSEDAAMQGEVNFTMSEEFRPYRSVAGSTLSIYVMGRAIIGYDDSGAWTVETIAISTDTGGLSSVEKSDPLFRSIASALRQNCSAEIEALISDDIRDRGDWRDPNDEHRFGIRELGLVARGALLAVLLLCVGAMFAQAFIGGSI